MLKRMLPIIPLIVCSTQASDGQCPIELAPDQAQVYGLYAFGKDTELKRKSITSGLLICEITPYGKCIFDQCKDRPFKVHVKQDEPLECISDCEFIELINADKLTIDNGATLKLSYDTLGKIRSVIEGYHIHLQKPIQGSEVVLLWQAQKAKKVQKKEAGLPYHLSYSADEVKDMVFDLLR